MRKLREIVRWLMPYGIVSSYVEKNYRRRFNFIEAFKQYVEKGETCQFADDSPYESIVSVQGFGYSGSGAVVDLLREYNTTHVIGYVDYEGSASSRNIKCDEVDVLRLAGGLFEVEKYLGSNNVFQNDALLHRVVAQFDHSDLYRNNPNIRPYYYEFMKQICEILTASPECQDYNPYLNHRGANDILFLKEIKLEAYRKICRRFLNSIFMVIHQSTGNKPILVLDQITNDWEFDIERYKMYIPNLKIIMVYRDPRDVYAFAQQKNIGWIPHKTAKIFIQWYKVLLKHFDIHEKTQYLVVQFEGLINNYEQVASTIEKFVGVRPEMHIYRGRCLDLSRSRLNLSNWKSFKNDTYSMDTIYNELSFLCYDE